MVNDIKDTFRDKFYILADNIEKKYGKLQHDSLNLVGNIINNYLDELLLDVARNNFKDFYIKHLQGTLYLGCEDFTAKEIDEIIDNSRLSPDDRRIAHHYYVEQSSANQIGDNVAVDPRTIRTKLPSISLELKQTASKLYSKR